MWLNIFSVAFIFISSLVPSLIGCGLKYALFKKFAGVELYQL